jgi:alpha-mannosidase
MDSHWRGLSCKTTVGETIYAYGWGDGGGGVDPEMLESARRYRDFPGLVPTTYSFVEEALDSIKAKAEANGAPVWSDELYLEAHRGTYTTKGKLKKLNRRLEFLLRDAEMASAFAWLAGGEYPRERIDEAWKTLLTNQFHDALPGTHVPQAYADMLRDYAHLLTEGAALRDAGLDAALADAGVVGATRTAEGMIQMVVVNTLLHQRTDVVAVAADAIGDATVLDMEGVAAPRQAVTTLEGERQVLLDIAGVSGCGYSTFALTDPVPEEEPCVEVTDRTLENDYLKATFNDEGELVSLFDKLFEREIVKPGALAHRFRLFEDIPGRYDAWDIIDGYRDHEIDISGNAELTVDEQGPVRASLRLVKRFLTSTIEQRISLSAGARQLVFETRVDWKERQKLLKDEFALNLNCRTATYDIAYGNIERSTHRNTPYDAAKFEVCGHLWADCSEGDYGVAILNDGKYGYEVNGATMQVSLLKGSIFPDPNADLEEHFFTYALYCHPGDWRAGEVMQEALQLNVPPVIRFAGEVEESDYSFIAGSAENVTLEAVKRAEDDQGLIVRLVERENRLTSTEVVFDRPVTQAWSCNLMEDTEDELTVEENRVLVTLKPYEIVTLRVIL